MKSMFLYVKCVDIVNADVVMRRLHFDFWGSCSIGFCHFSTTQICSLMKCCLLTEKCIFSQREDTVMHLYFTKHNRVKSNLLLCISNNLQ